MEWKWQQRQHRCIQSRPKARDTPSAALKNQYGKFGSCSMCVDFMIHEMDLPAGNCCEIVICVVEMMCSTLLSDLHNCTQTNSNHLFDLSKLRKYSNRTLLQLWLSQKWPQVEKEMFGSTELPCLMFWFCARKHFFTVVFCLLNRIRRKSFVYLKYWNKNKMKTSTQWLVIASKPRVSLAKCRHRFIIISENMKRKVR